MKLHASWKASADTRRLGASSNHPFSIMLLGIAQVCSWGTLYYSFPQIAEAAMAEFSWNKSETYGALTLGLMLSAFAGLPIGSAIDRGYGRLVMTWGSVLAGLLFILGSQLNSLLGFYILFGAIGFLHSATLYEAAFSVIANRFDGEQSKKHITTLTLWGGFASTLFIPLIEWLLQNGDWRLVMQIIGLINILICGVIYYRLPQANPVLVEQHCCEKEQKEQEELQQKKLLQQQKDKPKRNLAWALRQPIFWALLICFSIFAAATTAFKFHLYPLLLEKGLSATEVVGVLVVLGPAQVMGRLILKLFAEKISMIHLGILVASALPVVFSALAFLPTEFWIIIPFAVLFGAATGTMTIVKGIAVPELLTRDAYGAINGAMNLPVKTIKALSPSIAAFIWVIAGGYQGLLQVLIILGALAALCFGLASLLTIKKTSSSHS